MSEICINSSIECPECGSVSYHPQDVEDGYCGACCDWTHGVVIERIETAVGSGVLVHQWRPKT